MSEVTEMEGFQLQIEELHAQLNTLRIGEAVKGSPADKQRMCRS